MSDLSQARTRESARTLIGRFGVHAHTAPDVPELRPRVASEAAFALFMPIEPPTGDHVYNFDHEMTGVDENRIWTVVESDSDSSLIAVPGKHLGREVGFMITKLPWDFTTGEHYFFQTNMVPCGGCGVLHDPEALTDGDCLHCRENDLIPWTDGGGRTRIDA